MGADDPRRQREEAVMISLFPPTGHGFWLFSVILSAVAFSAAIGVAACLRSPAARHRTWFLSFAVTGACLVAGLLRGELKLPILPPPGHSIEAKAEPVATGGKEIPAREKTVAFANGISFSASVASSISKPLGPWTVLPRSSRLLLLMWAAGTGFALLPLFLGEWQWQRMRRRCESVTDERIRDLYDRLCVSLGIRVNPLLLFSPDCQAPMLGCLWRACIVLPRAAAAWPESQCESALRHELAHDRRKDLAADRFCRIVTALLWFQPLAWLALGRLKREAEFAADDAVVAGQGAPEIYAEALLNLCRSRKERFPQAGLGIGSYLPLRLARILDPGAERKFLSPRNGIAIAAGVLGIALLLVLLKPVASNQAPALLQKIADKNEQAFAPAESLSFVEHDTILGDEAGRFQLEWWEKGSKCRYRYREFNDVGSVHFGMNYSYDGKTARRLEFGELGGSGGILYRKQGPRAFDDWLIYRTFITMPWDFAALAEPGALRSTPPLLLLKDAANWSRFLADAQLVGRETYQGRACVAVRVKNRTLRDSAGGEQRGDYVVYFDPARGYRPAGWKAYRGDGQLFQELIVTREEVVRDAGGAEITLPSAIKIIYRQSAWLVTFSDVTVNALGSFPFALDETLAKHIYDEEEKKWSKAPEQPFLSLVLPDLDFTGLTLKEIVPLLRQKARESDPELGDFSISCAWGSTAVLPKFSLRMNRPTVGQVLAEMQKQDKGLKVETSPKSLLLREF